MPELVLNSIFEAIPSDDAHFNVVHSNFPQGHTDAVLLDQSPFIAESSLCIMHKDENINQMSKRC